MSVNLLPWRERRLRRNKYRLLMISILSVLLFIGAFIGVNRWLVFQVTSLQEKNSELKQKISALAGKKIQVKQLQKKLEIAKQKKALRQQQQSHKETFLQLIYAVSRQPMDYIYFTALAMTAKNIIIAGRTTNQTALHQWLENMNYPPILAKPAVEKVQQINGALYPLQFVVKLTWQATIKN